MYSYTSFKDVKCFITFVFVAQLKLITWGNHLKKA